MFDLDFDGRDHACRIRGKVQSSKCPDETKLGALFGFL